MTYQMPSLTHVWRFPLVITTFPLKGLPEAKQLEPELSTWNDKRVLGATCLIDSQILSLAPFEKKFIEAELGAYKEGMTNVAYDNGMKVEAFYVFDRGVEQASDFDGKKYWARSFFIMARCSERQ